jgi:hypothetical protein
MKNNKNIHALIPDGGIWVAQFAYSDFYNDRKKKDFDVFLE